MGMSITAQDSATVKFTQFGFGSCPTPLTTAVGIHKQTKGP